MKLIRNISLPQNDLSAIKEASALLKKNFPVNEVRLFGSKARGDERKTARRSRNYVEWFFVKSDEVAAKQPKLQPTYL